jgi:hypothetical protein
MKLFTGNSRSDDDDDDIDDNKSGNDSDEIGLEIDGGNDSDDDANNVTGAEAIERLISPEDRYKNECGYGFILALQGRTTGRKLKREICKLALLQFICGVALLVIVSQVPNNYELNHYLHRSVTTVPIIVSTLVAHHCSPYETICSFLLTVDTGVFRRNNQFAGIGSFPRHSAALGLTGNEPIHHGLHHQVLLFGVRCHLAAGAVVFDRRVSGLSTLRLAGEN